MCTYHVNFYRSQFYNETELVEGLIILGVVAWPSMKNKFSVNFSETTRLEPTTLRSLFAGPKTRSKRFFRVWLSGGPLVQPILMRRLHNDPAGEAGKGLPSAMRGPTGDVGTHQFRFYFPYKRRSRTARPVGRTQSDSTRYWRVPMNSNHCLAVTRKRGPRR